MHTKQEGSKMFCRNCGKEMDNNASVCVSCGASTGKGNGFCPNCGNQVSSESDVCVKCGYALNKAVSGEQKSKLVAGLLAILIGSLGIHNFYLGYTTKAIIQLLVAIIGGVLTCGIATFAIEIWAIVEGIMIFTGGISKDGHGVPLKD